MFSVSTGFFFAAILFPNDEARLTCGDVCYPQGESVWDNGVAKFQCKGTALSFGARRCHVRIVKAEVRTPRLETRLTRLLDIGRACS